MATKKEDKQPESVEVALLRDCVFGACGEVVTLSRPDAEQALAQGMADANPAAVSAAKS